MVRFPYDAEQAERYTQECRTLGSDLKQNSTASVTCAAGYNGRLCTNCARDYYGLGSECLPCRGLFGSKALFAVLIAICVAAMWFVVNFLAVADASQAFAASLTFLQVLGTVTAFGLGWPDIISYVISPLLQTIQFDVNFFKPECIRTGISESTWQGYSFGYDFQLYIQC